MFCGFVYGLCIEIGDLLGVSDRQYSNIENGRSDASASQLIILADYFNVTIDYLLGRTDGPKTYVKIAHTDLGDAILRRTIPDELTPDEIEAVRRIIEKYDHLGNK